MLLSDDQFEDLYDFLSSPEILGADLGLGRETCDHTLRHTITWMLDEGVQVRENIAKIVDLGGHCDCEVLLNVDPDTWAERSEEEVSGPDHLGEEAWQQMLSDLLLKSGYDQA